MFDVTIIRYVEVNETFDNMQQSVNFEKSLKKMLIGIDVKRLLKVLCNHD